ncbi:integrase core domain-containing protein [Planosporangium sp. 12N6]
MSWCRRDRSRVEDWRIAYNSYRPHGSLDWLTPDAFHEQWITNRQPPLS